MFFLHFFILESLFASVELNKNIQSGRAILIAIDIFIIFLAIIALIIITIYERYTGRRAKTATYLVVLSNCICLFYWQSNYERQMFTRPDRFDISSIIIILLYFALELFLTFYIVNRLYRSKILKP